MLDGYATSFDGCQIYFKTSARTGTVPVVLSHGLGCTHAHWDSLFGTLEERHTVVCYDSRGHGRSGAPPGEYTVEMMGRDALAVFEHLAIETAHFVGLSQGGMTGIWLAAHHGKRIDRLVVANSAAYIPAKEMLVGFLETARSDGLSRVADRMMTNWLGPRFKENSPAASQQLIKNMQQMSVDGFIGAVSALRDVDLRANLDNVHARTLILAGSDEPPPLLSAAEALTARIEGASLELVADSGHLTNVENSSAFNALVSRFLQI